MSNKTKEGERKFTTYEEASSVFLSWMRSEGATKEEAKEVYIQAHEDNRSGYKFWDDLSPGEQFAWSRLNRLGIDPITLKPLNETESKRWKCRAY